MRNAFIQQLHKHARKDRRIMVLSGDLGYTVFEDFMADCPQQFINMGLGEPNMMGVAAGMAAEGKIPIVYSIIPFVTLRCVEQIRNDVCVHNSNVKIIGVGSGLGYAHLGTSHHAAEDVAVMRALANMTVLSPADAYETEAAVVWALRRRGPVYIRLGKRGEPAIHRKKVKLHKIPRPLLVRPGRDILIYATGTIVYNVLQAADILEKKGINACVVSIPGIKPLDVAGVAQLAGQFSATFTVEEHSIIGGLGSAISETLLEAGIPVKRFQRIGIDDTYCHAVGDYAYIRSRMGLSPQKIARKVLKSL